MIAAGSLDKTVKLWNLQAGMPIGTSRQHSGTVRALAMDPYLLVYEPSQPYLYTAGPVDSCGRFTPEIGFGGSCVVGEKLVCLLNSACYAGEGWGGRVRVCMHVCFQPCVSIKTVSCSSMCVNWLKIWGNLPCISTLMLARVDEPGLLPIVWLCD